MGQKNQMRNLVAQQAKTNAANTATDRATMLGATGKVTGVANQLLPTVDASGALNYPAAKLSPYAASSFAAANRNIIDAYNKQRQAGFAAMGRSGFGSSPGAVSSLYSTLGRSQGSAQTDAYNKALQDSLDQMLQGANIEQNVSRQYGGQSLDESQLASGQAQQRVGMGSTAGDVLAGVSTLATPVLNAFAPGGGFANIGKKTGATKSGFNNIRDYAPSGQGSYGVPA